MSLPTLSLVPVRSSTLQLSFYIDRVPLFPIDIVFSYRNSPFTPRLPRWRWWLSVSRRKLSLLSGWRLRQTQCSMIPVGIKRIVPCSGVGERRCGGKSSSSTSCGMGGVLISPGILSPIGVIRLLGVFEHIGFISSSKMHVAPIKSVLLGSRMKRYPFTPSRCSR